MVRAFVLYESEPDPERYRQHIDEFALEGLMLGVPAREDLRVAVRRAQVPLLRGVRVGRHGRLQGGRANSEEFAASGKDAMAMGIPFTVHFAEIAEE